MLSVIVARIPSEEMRHASLLQQVVGLRFHFAMISNPEANACFPEANVCLPEAIICFPKQDFACRMQRFAPREQNVASG